jgi:Uma2 family endonuclease
MAILVLDDDLEQRLIEERQNCDGDRYDEVWDGVRVMSPLADIKHQLLQMQLAAIFHEVLGVTGRGLVMAGVNVSDRKQGWEQNYRVPDVAVLLPNSTAEDCGTHLRGGPDFAVEITSRGDKVHEKLPFYEKVRTRELLIVDRKPWSLDLHRLADEQLGLVGVSTATGDFTLKSDVVPFTFCIVTESNALHILVASTEESQQWKIKVEGLN